MTPPNPRPRPVPAWLDAPELTVTLAQVRASIDSEAARVEAEKKPESKPRTRRRNP